MYKAPSMPNNVGSSAIVKINEDGTVNLLVTAMSIMTGDTDCTPYEWQTVASRTTYCCGNSVKRAAEDAKNQMLRLASLKFGISEEYF